MKTNVYIDGFNLYYGCLKDTPYKWLDLSQLSRYLLPEYHINRLRYFTALVQPRENDPGKLDRQLTFLRALQTIPGLSIHKGQFLTKKTRMALVDPPVKGPKTVLVWDTKEKGSDVALATYLLIDGFQGDYEAAAIISNDSDLMEPIRFVREKLQRPVIVLNPHRKVTSYALLSVASSYRKIREGVLRVSQFPDQLEDEHGVMTKPSKW